MKIPDAALRAVYGLETRKALRRIRAGALAGAWMFSYSMAGTWEARQLLCEGLLLRYEPAAHRSVARAIMDLDDFVDPLKKMARQHFGMRSWHEFRRTAPGPDETISTKLH